MNHSGTETARVTVLTVPDCPNAPLIRERITEALQGWVRFPRDAECVDRGSDGSHERNIDHGRPQKVLA
ncbi:hypothetical protein ACWD1Z_36775, partial [Streptomyces sp. NPDC002784]